MWQTPEQQDAVEIPRTSQAQTAVDKDRAEISHLKGTRVPATGIAFSRRLEDRQEDITTTSWLSTSILHDLRSPLAAISAGAEILMDVDPLPTEVKRLATTIYSAAGRLQELMTDLTSVIRGNRPTVEICDIREIIAAASDAASAATGNNGVGIVLDVPRKIELPLQRSRMKRVFFNLITNALEAMPGGGDIRIVARKADNCVLIELEDTGPGIPRRIRNRLFEPFVTTGKQDGMGLGLALSRQTVLDHGGDIWTEPAAGCRFVIRLPLNRDPHLRTGSLSMEWAYKHNERGTSSIERKYA
jgi:two-component system, NtrC family, sensor histidine kinase HydH